MADQLDKIVQVTIERRTRVPGMKSFSEHLVVDEFSPVGITPVFDPEHRVRVFGSLDEIAAAGFSPEGFVYRAAAKQYSQSPHIGNLYVGWKIPGGLYRAYAFADRRFVSGNILHWQVGTAQMPDISFDEEGSHQAVIDRILSVFNEDFGNECRLKQEGDLKLSFYGGWKVSQMSVEGGASQPSIAWKNSGGDAADVSGSNCVIAPDASWTAALTKIKEQNDEWYAVSVSARRMDNQQECALWVQANEKLCILTSGDDLLPNAETGDIAAWAKLNNLDRVAVFYHPDAKLADAAADALSASDPVPEAAYFGKMLTKQPGSPTWKFKELQSVPAYELSQGQVKNVEDKNATWYMSTADVPMTSNGQVASGEYIDVIHGLDWLKARIQNLVFTALIGVDKVPFTDEGIQMVVSPLKAALEEAKKNGILASYEVEYPAAADVSITDKGRRFLPDVDFNGVLAGAIHATKIKGVVTL
jgi:hypothetical protein